MCSQFAHELPFGKMLTTAMDVQGTCPAERTQDQMAFLHQQFHGIIVQQQALLLQYQQLEAYKQVLWAQQQSDAASTAPVAVPWAILAAQEKLANEQAVLRKHNIGKGTSTEQHSSPHSQEGVHVEDQGRSAKHGLEDSRAAEVLHRVKRQICQSLSSSARHDIRDALRRAGKPPRHHCLQPAFALGQALLAWLPPRKPPRSSQAATQPAASEPGPSTPPPAKRTKAEKAADPTQPTKGTVKGKGKAAKAKPALRPGRWLDRDCNAALQAKSG
ncbi:hypothetical protein QJQ45_005245 [Haematococcus lacustris]|nr:hypothetical protein QJQ45_005245 [Haematococcus lacustris]